MKLKRAQTKATLTFFSEFSFIFNQYRSANCSFVDFSAFHYSVAVCTSSYRCTVMQIYSLNFTHICTYLKFTELQMRNENQSIYLWSGTNCNQKVPQYLHSNSISLCCANPSHFTNRLSLRKSYEYYWRIVQGVFKRVDIYIHIEMS